MSITKGLVDMAMVKSLEAGRRWADTPSIKRHPPDPKDSSEVDSILKGTIDQQTVIIGGIAGFDQSKHSF